MWGRATAAAIPGFLLSTGLTGLICWLWPGPWQSTLVAGVIAFFAIWMGAMALAFQFRNGRRAWAWFGGGAVLSLAALWALQTLQWVH
jgi:hypothetical protein